MRHLILLLLIGFGLNAQKIEFRKISFQEGLEAAAEENKPVFIDCFTTWCGPCKWMSANIFTIPEVANYYNENYICLKIDMEKGEGIDIAKRYEIRAYPTLLYLDSKGERLLVKVGASQEMQSYIDAGEQAKDPKRNLPYMLEHVEDNFTDQAFMHDYFMTVSAANMMPEGMVDQYFEQFPIEEWLQGDNWEIVNEVVSDLNSETLKTLAVNSELVSLRQAENGMDFLEQRIFYGLANKLFRARTEEAKAEYEVLRSQYLSEDFPLSGKISFRLDLMNYERLKDFKGYASVAQENVQNYLWDDANELNNVAWTFYEKVEDQQALLSALRWAQRAVELAPEHHILDTYAHLLAETGKKEKALEVELMALEKAQAEEASTKSYQKFIDELKD